MEINNSLIPLNYYRRVTKKFEQNLSILRGPTSLLQYRPKIPRKWPKIRMRFWNYLLNMLCLLTVFITKLHFQSFLNKHIGHIHYSKNICQNGQIWYKMAIFVIIKNRDIELCVSPQRAHKMQIILAIHKLWQFYFIRNLGHFLCILGRYFNRLVGHHNIRGFWSFFLWLSCNIAMG